ncbi:MAG: Glu-tRNA(Gln) amidotransferase subunit GatE [archaeon]
MEIDYKKLGFKAGIEIHQELNTKKLFCNCSSSFKEKKLDSNTHRKMRAVAGETGDIDLASAYEQFRNREFIYHGYDNEACLIELDEEPPLPVDNEAFETALTVAKLFKLKIPDTICVMRKTVTDGSAVSGFQRTILVGMESSDSDLETSQGKVKIQQLNLEEDACKIEEKKDETVYYSLSRLGIPLLEIGTDASLKDPDHVYEAALLIGTYLRSFNVKRGLGTIRQDVNVSIAGGARIEVKGWQDIKKLKELVENETLRQYNLLEIKKELEKRGLASFQKKSENVTKVFEKSESKIISDLIKHGGQVHALLLPKFSGLLKKEVCHGKTFGKELSEYAKAFGTKGMIHTDEDISKYKLEKEFEELRKKISCGPSDLMIVIAEKEDIAVNAVHSVYERALYCLKGIPEETRIPNHHDATSSYARPLPGAHRLYPETDVPNIIVDAGFVDRIKLPELLPEKIRRYNKEFGLDEGLSKEILRKELDFDELVHKFDKIDPKFLASVIIEYPKEIRKRYNKTILTEDHADLIFSKLNQKKISKEAIFEILVDLAEGKKVDFAKYAVMDDSELEKEIKKIIKENIGSPQNALIGKVMEKLRGKADGKKIIDTIKKLI